MSRRKLSGAHKDHAMYCEYVDPEETEGERYAVYESAPAQLRTLERVCTINRPAAKLR